MKTTPLHSRFGLVIHDVDLRTVTSNHLFPEIRHAFETHSALLFRNQSLDPAAHQHLAELFGPLENRDAMSAGRDVPFEIPVVSNETETGISPEDSVQVMNLQGNMLWHTDSTFLPVPALVNILVGRVLTTSGGETELASTRTGWADMPAAMKDQFRDAIVWHRLSHSRSKISAELAALPMFNRWPDRPWKAVWPNPVTGDEALYIASHAFAIEGMGLEEGQALLDAATEICTLPENVYTHQWQPGDVLIWDERAMLHRGRPWPYDQPRTLSSICCSATEADGLNEVRVI